LLVPRDDPEAVAEAVTRILGDAPLRDRLVVEGNRRVRAEFSEERGIEAFRRLVDDVLVEPPLRG
jgi:glycosyltransferase involved in cell wall biosynthesis